MPDDRVVGLGEQERFDVGRNRWLAPMHQHSENTNSEAGTHWAFFRHEAEKEMLKYGNRIVNNTRQRFQEYRQVPLALLCRPGCA